MKFSAVVISVALAATQTSAFMAPAPARSVKSVHTPLFSSETTEESAPTTTTTTTEDAPGTINLSCGGNR